MDVPGRLIEAVYDAAVEPTLWQAAIDAFALAAKADSALLYTPDADPQVDGLWVAGNLDPRSLDEYRAHYGAHDIWLKGWRQLGRDGTYLGGMLAARPRLIASAFYNDFLRRYDIQDLCTLVVGASGSPTSFANMSFYRGLRRDQFEEMDTGLFQHVEPHLRRALAIHARMAKLRQRNTELATALDATQEAVLLIDGQARIHHANQAAEDLVRKGAGLLAQGGRLQAIIPRQQDRLSAAIGAAAGRNQPAEAGAVLISGADDQGALHLILVPAGRHLRGRVLVLAGNRDGQPPPSLKPALVALFGASAAEAELGAALAAGLRLDEIATATGRAKTTIRTQLQALFWKTQTSSQAELIRLMLSIPRAWGEQRRDRGA